MAEFINSLDKTVEIFERNIIEKALKDVSGNQTKAALVLGISKRKIQYKICKYGIDFRAIKEEYRPDIRTLSKHYKKEALCETRVY
jgi:DNA-binding NtrC family response regulator